MDFPTIMSELDAMFAEKAAQYGDGYKGSSMEVLNLALRKFVSSKRVLSKQSETTIMKEGQPLAVKGLFSTQITSSDIRFEKKNGGEFVPSYMGYSGSALFVSVANGNYDLVTVHEDLKEAIAINGLDSKGLVDKLSEMATINFVSDPDRPRWQFKEGMVSIVHSVDKLNSFKQISVFDLERGMGEVETGFAAVNILQRRIDEQDFAFHITDRDFGCYMVALGHDEDKLQKIVKDVNAHCVERRHKIIGWNNAPVKKMMDALGAPQDEGWDVDKLTGDRKSIFGSSGYSFIAKAGNIESAQSRLYFIKDVLSLGFDDPLSSENQDLKQTLLSKLLNKSEEGRSFASVPNTDLISAIDSNGEISPYQVFAKQHGFENATDKEVKFALSLLAQSLKRDAIDLNIEVCLSVAILPKDWFRLDSGKLISDGFDRRTSDIWHIISQEVVSGAKNIDASRGMIKNGGDEAKKGKQLQKNVAKSFSWLSVGKGDFKQRLLTLNNKYKITSSLEDYKSIMTGILGDMSIRLASEMSEQGVGNIAYIDHFNKLTINESKLNVELSKKMTGKTGEGSISIMSRHDEAQQEVIWETFGNYEKGSLLDLFKKNDQLHKDYNAFIRLANGGGKTSDIEWTGLFAEAFIKDDFLVVPLDSKSLLMEEGDEMGHCIFSYMDKCMRGASSVFSVRDKEGQRLATVELSTSGEFNIDKPEFDVDYNGPENDPVSEHVAQFIDQLVLDIKDKSMPIQDFSKQNVSLPNMRQVREDPLKYGEHLAKIPYNSDAAYLSFFFAEKNMVTGYSVDEFFALAGEGEIKNVYSLAYELSYFKHDIQNIRALSKEVGIKPYELVSAKIRGKVPTFDLVQSYMDYEKDLGKAIEAINEIVGMEVSELGVKSDKKMVVEGHSDILDQVSAVVMLHLGDVMNEGEIRESLYNGTISKDVHQMSHPFIRQEAPYEPDGPAMNERMARLEIVENNSPEDEPNRVINSRRR